MTGGGAIHGSAGMSAEGVYFILFVLDFYFSIIPRRESYLVCCTFMLIKSNRFHEGLLNFLR